MCSLLSEKTSQSENRDKFNKAAKKLIASEANQAKKAKGAPVARHIKAKRQQRIDQQNACELAVVNIPRWTVSVKPIVNNVTERRWSKYNAPVVAETYVMPKPSVVIPDVGTSVIVSHDYGDMKDFDFEDMFHDDGLFVDNVDAQPLRPLPLRPLPPYDEGSALDENGFVKLDEIYF